MVRQKSQRTKRSHIVPPAATPPPATPADRDAVPPDVVEAIRRWGLVQINEGKAFPIGIFMSDAKILPLPWMGEEQAKGVRS